MPKIASKVETGRWRRNMGLSPYTLDSVKFYGGIAVAFATFATCVWAVLQ